MIDIMIVDNFVGHLFNQLPFEEFQKELHRIAHEDIRIWKISTCQFNPNISYAYSFADEIMLWVEIPKYIDLVGRTREFLPVSIILSKEIAMNFNKSDYDQLMNRVRSDLNPCRYIAYITGEGTTPVDDKTFENVTKK